MILAIIFCVLVFVVLPIITREQPRHHHDYDTRQHYDGKTFTYIRKCKSCGHDGSFSPQ